MIGEGHDDEAEEHLAGAIGDGDEDDVLHAAGGRRRRRK